ncbi:MAG: acyl-CoA synthetase [Alphaproteobacteria bacterium]
MADAMNLGRLLSDVARRLPDRPALVWRDRVWTWAETDRRVGALVAGLRHLGVAKGDRVMLHAQNSNALIESMWAVFRIGAVWVPNNVRLTAPEVAGLAETCRPKAIVYGPGFDAQADAAIAAGAGIVIALDEARAGERAYEELLAAHAGAAAWEAEIGYDDPLWFFFTSGTTGRPKAAVLTHGQMAFVVVNHIADLMPGLSAEDAALVVAPLSHGAGVHYLVNAARGARTVLLPTERFDPAEAWRLVAQHRVTNMFTVPTIVKLLVEHPAVDEHDHTSLRWVIYAGAPMYREDQSLALRKLGRVLVQYYGLGEVTGAITVLPAHLHSDDDSEMPVGSCGYARTGMEIAIRDPDGTRLGPGEMGEICARGPAVFAGYYGNPEATAKALREGWFHTGDLGYLDPAGFLYITGRASDMYISGGANVYPRDAEEVLLQHPMVAEVAVLGVPDPKWGESGVAVVVAAAGAAADADALLVWMDGRLARYKWPRRFFFWDALPKSGYGKVPKHLIRRTLFERGDLKEGEPV